MASSILIKVTYLTMICLVLSIPLADATVSCCNIETTLIPCIGYIRNPGPSVDAPCCDAVKAVSDAAQTPIDRQDTCKCLMSLIKSPGIEFQDVASIPDKCGHDPPFVLTPDLDCNTYNSHQTFLFHIYTHTLTVCFFVFLINFEFQPLHSKSNLQSRSLQSQISFSLAATSDFTLPLFQSWLLDLHHSSTQNSCKIFLMIVKKSWLKCGVLDGGKFQISGR
ncbi:unnamed protein product [Trifolium pratense]|uniref:Uncharacterized protein n=1 Tax=Trifolium pratense TaxID=57577 RepID=A0ACB0LQA6_TRIPR|nr:unnamed protein product [Trifolium pratense]